MQERQIHRMFEVGVLLKGAHALLECVGGLALMLTSAESIRHFVQRVTFERLGDERFDTLARWTINWSRSFSTAEHDFFVVYLLSHGIVKLVLVAGLLARRLWAYPASLVVMSLFIAYQMNRYRSTHEVALIALTVFDLVVIWLIWHEYQRMRHHLPLE